MNKWARKFEDLYYDICRLLITVRTFFYDIKRGLLNLIKWAPVIWKDRCWDHYFIYEILKTKLKFTHQYLEKHGHHLHVDKDVKNIKIAEFLIERIQKNNYCVKENKDHKEKWGSYNWDKFFDRTDKTDNVLFDNKFSNRGLRRPNVKSQKDFEQEYTEHRRIIKHEAYLLKQDKDFLFKHLNKHISGWWD